jgi:hypothetical protein
MTKLAMADDLALERRPTTDLATQLADDATSLLVYVYVLAHERRAIAVDAAMTIGCQGADAATQEEALELLHVYVWGGHGATFARVGSGPALFIDLSARFV